MARRESLIECGSEADEWMASVAASQLQVLLEDVLTLALRLVRMWLMLHSIVREC